MLFSTCTPNFPTRLRLIGDSLPIRTTAAPNANAGREHVFVAYRLSGDPEEAVTLRNRETVLEELRSAEAMPHED
jgi:hypothetical protein